MCKSGKGGLRAGSFAVILVFSMMTISGSVSGVAVAGNNSTAEIGETGRVTFSEGTNQQTISLTQSYRNPVIIAKPVDDAATDPRYVRVVGNTSDSITLEVDRFENDGVDPETTVHYLVFEAGIHELQDGTTIEAGSNQVGGSYDSVTLDASFSSAPTVFSQTQTVNDATPVVVRQRNVGTGSFAHKLQESEAGGQSGHAAERVGYVAIQQAQGTADGVTYEVSDTGNTVKGYNNGFTTIGFSQSYSSTPAFFAQMQTENGGNTAWERYRNLDTANVDVTLDEETTGDSERSHTTENVGYFVFGDLGVISGTILSSSGIDTTDASETTDADTVLSVADGASSDLLELATDPDGDSLSLAAINGTSFSSGTPVTLGSGATVTAYSNGHWTYNPNGQFQGLSDGATATDSFTYSVTDGDGHLGQGTITITINAPDDDDYIPPDNTPPTADAGPDKSVTVGESVTLDGSNSSDNEELDVLQWDVDDDGGYESVGETITRDFDSPGEYTVTLRVWDDGSNSDTDTVIVDVSPKTTSGSSPTDTPTTTTTTTTTTTSAPTTATDTPDTPTITASPTEDENEGTVGGDVGTQTSTTRPDSPTTQSAERDDATATAAQPADDSGTESPSSADTSMLTLVLGVLVLIGLLVAAYSVIRGGGS